MGSGGEVKEVRKKRKYTMTEKAIASRQNNNLSYPVAKTDEQFDYNSRLIEHVMRTNEIAAQADRNDLNTLKSCFLNYMNLCQQDGFSVSNIGVYRAMGFDHVEFAQWSKRQDPDIRAFAKFVRETCAMFRETMIKDNKINPVIGIFWQRNFDGLRNDTEQVQAIQEQEDEYAQFGGSSYKDRYRNLIGSGDKE